MKIRTSMGGSEVIVDDKVIGHIDEEGFWPAVKHDFFKLSPANLRTLASNIDGIAAYKRTIGKREVIG